MKNHNPYVGGVADCWYSGTAGDLWVEYKFLELPKKPTTIVDLCGGSSPALSALQQEWLRNRHHEGRSVGVIIGTRSGGVWRPGISWDKPMSSADLRAEILDKPKLAAIITGTVSLP